MKTLQTLALLWLAYQVLKPKPAPRGELDIGEPTIGSNPDEWANPYR